MNFVDLVDLIEKELNMEWTENFLVHYDDIGELLQVLEQWMATSRSEDFFKEHQCLSREYVQEFIDFLNKIDCFCQEAL